MTKSESLTLRLNPRTRFVLEFMSRISGQNITTVIERAVIQIAEGARDPYSKDHVSWKNLWDASEGVRALRMASYPSLYPTLEEEKRLEFTKKFWEFFYTNEKFEDYRRDYIDIIWDRIDYYISMHEQDKKIDYFSAGFAMYKAIELAGLETPKWPRKSNKGDDPAND